MSSDDWTLVILESPFRGEGDSPNQRKEAEELNKRYARACMRDCLLRREAPFASHLLYTQPGVLDDGDGDERARGIEAGLAWGRCAEKTVVYTDLGISKGMRLGIERAKELGRPCVERTLHNWVVTDDR